MNKEEQIGTLVGLDLILSPEHYKEINDLKEENKQLKEIVYNLTTMTVCGDRKQIKNTAQYKLEQLQKVLTELEEYIKNHYIVGHTIQNASLDGIINKLNELKEKYK